MLQQLSYDPAYSNIRAAQLAERKQHAPRVYIVIHVDAEYRRRHQEKWAREERISEEKAVCTTPALCVVVI